MTTSLQLELSASTYIGNIFETTVLCQNNSVVASFHQPRSHTGERPFKCVQCSRGFASSGVLKAHIRTHSGLKAYKCLMCDTTFTTSGSLRRHMTTHSDLRPYMCPYCQKTFKSSPNCRKHMKTHRFGLLSQVVLNIKTHCSFKSKNTNVLQSLF